MSSSDVPPSALPAENSCGPSLAMQAWWMRVLSSAYGSGRFSGVSGCWPASASRASGRLPVGRAVLPLESIVEAHRQLLDNVARKLFFCFAAAWAATSCLPIARMAREKSAFESASTAGLPRLTDTGTVRSLGTS